MILELLAAGLILLLYVPLARRMQSGEPPRGMLANLLEMVLTFVRDQIARPNIGEHDADRYVPFLWTLFLFILVNNLFGLIPLGGSPTASPSVVIALALWAFFFIHGAGVRTQGLGHYLKAQWPDIDVPFPMDYIIKPVVCFIEITGILGAQCGPGRASFCQYVRRPHGSGDDFDLHLRGLDPGRGPLLDGDRQ